MVRKLSSSSEHFAYFLDILYCKVSENSSANNELVAKTFRICKNFLVSIADALTGFCDSGGDGIGLVGWMVIIVHRYSKSTFGANKVV